jgi:hypothetical protein
VRPYAEFADNPYWFWFKLATPANDTKKHDHQKDNYAGETPIPEEEEFPESTRQTEAERLAEEMAKAAQQVKAEEAEEL